MKNREGPAANERAQARHRRDLKDAQRTRDDCYRRILRTPEGRCFMYDLIYGTLGLESGYVGQDAGVYRQLGRQDAAREIKNRILELDPDAWERAVTEQLHSLKAIQYARQQDEMALDDDEETDT